MTLSVGMLGYRFMGRAHANALARLPMFFPDAPAVERDVLIGRDEEALADAADRLGFARTATDWRDVVDDVDVFYNLGPNNLHAEPSIAALDAGTPVLSEKPLADTLEDAGAMAAAAAEATVPTATAFNYRFVPAIQYARELIRSGELGEIRQFRGRYLQDWLADPKTPWVWRLDADVAGSGALGDLGAHTLDMARYLVGDVADVSGRLETFVEERPVEDGDETRDVTVDDAFAAHLAFENGALGTVEATRFATGHKNDHSVAVHGSKGSVRFSLERLNELEVLLAEDRGYQTVLVTDAEDPYGEHWWPPGHVLGWEHTFIHENYAFLSAVAEGESYEPNFADGLAGQRLLDAVEGSDETGSRVAIE